MTDTELNSYIKHYFEKDKTNSAIMLSAPWGTGKSFYIKNILTPFLQKSRIACIIISLYGLKSIDELSKNLYFEIRFKKIKKFSKIQFLGKTFLKSLMGHLSFNLEISESDLKKLYNSVDVTGKLIIFEDIERSQINILEFMGYVNNLVEQDNAKILLIANENEIIKYNDKSLSEESKEYLKIKEKTINDTILYKCSYSSAIKTIVENIESDCEKKILTRIVENYGQEINSLYNSENFNLRSFIFACQKTKDLLEDYDSEINFEFIKEMFFGIIIYTSKIKNGKTLKWVGNTQVSYELGNEKYPLYYFCYDYITNHNKQNKCLESGNNIYNEIILYDERKQNNDQDLLILYNYFNKTEEEVTKSLQNILTKLKNNKISLYQYGRLANYLISLHENLNWNISPFKKLIIKNLKGKGDKIDFYLLFKSGIGLKKEAAEEFEEFKMLMKDSLQSKMKWPFNFLEKQNIFFFYNNIDNNMNEILNKKGFMKFIDPKDFYNFLLSCSSEEINQINSLFFKIYSMSNISNYLKNDLENLSLLIKLLENTNDLNSSMDSIQKMQLSFFKFNCKKIYDKLTS